MQIEKYSTLRVSHHLREFCNGLFLTTFIHTVSVYLYNVRIITEEGRAG